MLRHAGLPVLTAALILAAPAAEAHPHVFVTVKSTVVYENSMPKEVRHVWRFDDMFSAFAIQGLDTDTDGNLSREELQALAEVNVTSLKEFDFFTFAQAAATDVQFTDPVNYFLDYDGKALTLHFTLPVASPAKADTIRFEVYDPSYFVAFDLAPDGPASLEGAPDGCRIDVDGPDKTTEEAKKLTEDFFSSLDPEEGWGKQFANTMIVRCGADAVAYAESIKPPPPPEPEPPPAPDAMARVEQAISIAENAPLQSLPEAKKESSPLGAFGIVRPDGTYGQSSSTFAAFTWIAQKQAEFYKQMSDALAASKANGSAWFLLIGLSFAYGIFHAAGPGHGKAVISSYLLATGETLKRGLLISFASAMAQAVTAIAVVGVMAVALGATSRAMGIATWWLEAASYALIVLLGIGLLFRRSLIPARARAHVHDENCSHSHGPDLKDLDGEFGWRRAGAAVLAIGLRPCTGALIVLIFALTQGLIWTGVAATFAMAFGTAVTVAAIATFAVLAKNAALKLASGSRPRGRRVLRLIEIAAGFAVLAFGLILLGGLLSAGLPTAAAV